MNSNLEDFANQRSAQSVLAEHKTFTVSALLADCGRSFTQAAVEKPVQGIVQLSDKLTGSNAAEYAQPIKNSLKSAAAEPAYYSEQISTAAGSAVPFILTALAVRPLAAKLLGETLFTAGMSAARAASFSSLSETAGAAFLSGTLFTPSQNDKTFWQDRLTNGAASTLTMTSLHVFSHGLAHLTGANSASASIALRALNSSVAGAGAGATAAEANSLLTTNKTATRGELYQSAIDMAVTGGVLGAAGDKFSQIIASRSNFPELEHYATRVYSNKPEENFCSHYLSYRVRQNPLDWLRLAKADQAESKPRSSSTQIVGEDHLTLGNWTPLERIKLLADLERDGRSPLAKPQTMRSFVDTLLAQGRDWQNDKIKTLADQRSTSFKLYTQSTTENAKEQSRLEQLLAQTPDPITSEIAQQKLDALKQKQEELDAVDSSYDKKWQSVLKRREAELQSAVNDFLSSQNLPQIKFSLDENTNSTASYNRGGIKVEVDIVNDAEIGGQLIGAIYHEVVHVEQDTLRIRNIADQLNISRNSTPEQISELTKKAYPKLIAYNTKLSRDQNAEARQFVADILAIRDGRPLTITERARAEQLAYAANHYRYLGLDKAAEYRWYMKNQLEVEAYPVGLLAFLMTNARKEARGSGHAHLSIDENK